MSGQGPRVTQNFRSFLELLHAGRFQSSNGALPKKCPTMAAAKLGSGYRMHPGLQFFRTTYSNTGTDTNGLKNVKVQPPVPASPSFSFPSWVRWILGSVLSLLLPFVKHNWEKLQRIEGETKVVVEEVEKVANVVEKLATVAEKVSEEVAEKLPENSKLKKAAMVVEEVSKQTANHAQLTEEFIRKVDELKNDLDDLESFVEPIIDKIVKKESERK